jgi:hypothetical protein
MTKVDNFTSTARCLRIGTRHLILGTTPDTPVEHIVTLVTLG